MAAAGAAALAALLGCPAEPALAQAATDPWLACAGAAAVAEVEAGLPAGLLLAIGKVESGRISPATGRLVPWPYAVNAGGRGILAGDRDAAVMDVQAARAGGVLSVDVGCFQVSLLHHPDAFETLEAGFDPLRNARYAAGFLASLRAGAASWQEAAGHYHSMTQAYAEPYAAQVMTAWAGLDAGPVRVGARTVLAAGVRFGMRVYVPGAGALGTGAMGAGAPGAGTAPAPAVVRRVAAEVRIGRGRGRLPVVYRPGGGG